METRSFLDALSPNPPYIIARRNCPRHCSVTHKSSRSSDGLEHSHRFIQTEGNGWLRATGQCHCPENCEGCGSYLSLVEQRNRPQECDCWAWHRDRNGDVDRGGTDDGASQSSLLILSRGPRGPVSCGFQFCDGSPVGNRERPWRKGCCRRRVNCLGPVDGCWDHFGSYGSHCRGG